MSHPHATIIGAGIVGVSSAAYLQRAGYRVTLIDRLPPGEGCSFGNAGGMYMPWAVGLVADLRDLHWGLAVSCLAPATMLPIVLALRTRFAD